MRGSKLRHPMVLASFTGVSTARQAGGEWWTNPEVGAMEAISASEAMTKLKPAKVQT